MSAAKEALEDALRREESRLDEWRQSKKELRIRLDSLNTRIRRAEDAADELRKAIRAEALLHGD